MAVLANRARMATATTGTGTITLGAAVAGFQTFAAAGIADGDVVRYVIEDGAAWEIGSGTYTASGTTLSRTVLESSNADAAISLSGSAEVFITAVASDLVQPDVAKQLSAAYTAAVDDDGTQSSGTYTPSVLAGSSAKKIVNGGAFTLAPPSPATGEYIALSLLIVNTTGAGAITTSGFTKVAGDSFTTTTTDEFLCHISVYDIGGTEYSFLDVVALQ